MFACLKRLVAIVATGVRSKCAMSVNVKYFASLREHLGQAESRCTVPDAGCSAAELWAQLNPLQAVPHNVLVAINQNYASLEARVNNGDEVAFFPPVTGG